MPETQGPGPQEDILRAIVRSKEAEVARLAPRRDRLRAAAEARPRARDFAGALASGGTVAVIAEVKRRSPGAGEIRPGLHAAALAASYQARGARALSVLTDGPFFGGGLDDLEAAREAVDIPVLRKDFTIDELQVDEARAGGADAVLLIVRILDDRRLRSLRERAETWGMTALVEVHSAAELERAVASGARVIGINNRDLATFSTDLVVTERLLGRLPTDTVVVSESGIRTADDVRRLGRAGVEAVLVGEALLRADEPGARVAELAGHPRRSRADV